MFTLTLLVFAVLGSIKADSEPQREVVLFDRADKNHDGLLTKGELDAIFFQFDVDHNKIITKTEFENDWVTGFQIGNLKEATVLFTHADVNDDGVINAADLPGIFSFFDMDSDGNVSVNEFLTQWGQLKLTAQGTILVTVDHTSAPHSTVPPHGTTT